MRGGTVIVNQRDSKASSREAKGRAPEAGLGAEGFPRQQGDEAELGRDGTRSPMPAAGPWGVRTARGRRGGVREAEPTATATPWILPAWFVSLG